MALLPILQYPHPTLAANAEPVTEFNDELKELATNMAETMYAAPGVGLAANQVGVLKRIIVIDVSEESNELRVFVNPQVIAHSDELEEFEEGCLSLKGLYEKVKRPERVTVRAQDLDGNPFELEADGLLAVCVQHEIDHLNGIVFIDHLSRLKKDELVSSCANFVPKKRRKPKTIRLPPKVWGSSPSNSHSLMAM